MGSWIDEIELFGDVLEIGLFGKALKERDLSRVPVQLGPLKSRSLINHWHSELPSLGLFDVILFHGNEMDKKDIEAGHCFLAEVTKTIQSVELAIPGLRSIHYSTQELESFCTQIGVSESQYLSRFLSDLRNHGQITEEQYQSVCKKVDIETIVPTEVFIRRSDHLFECVEECLKHVRLGGRFACQIGSFSRYEDPKFFENIIANPTLDYREISCGNENFILIEKLG